MLAASLFIGLSDPLRLALRTTANHPLSVIPAREAEAKSGLAESAPVADIHEHGHRSIMEEDAANLHRMSSAEGGAAADGLAQLLHHLLKSGQIDEALVSRIRDDMLLGLDPSIAAANDRGLQLAYANTLARYSFLSTAPRDLLEPDWEGGLAFRRMMEERKGSGDRR
ncbi:MAG TPA: hypothetical protein VM662_05235 [Sphingomonas sp.]|nr:hypothetical protein [Sphingomonas sp.]